MEQESTHTMEETAQDLDKKTAKKAKELKTKLNLSLAEDHPFSHLQLELRRRGLKHLDLGALLTEVFAELPENWWEQKLDDLTPLEYKVSQALADPKMRKKFNELLT